MISSHRETPVKTPVIYSPQVWPAAGGGGAVTEGCCTLITISLSLSLNTNCKYPLLTVQIVCKYIWCCAGGGWDSWDLNILWSQISPRSELALSVRRRSLTRRHTESGPGWQKSEEGRRPLEIFVWSHYHLVWSCLLSHVTLDFYLIN